MKPARFLAAALVAVSLAAAALPAAAEEEADAKNAKAETEGDKVSAFQYRGILNFETQDKRFRWWLDGRINVDAASYWGSENPLANGVELRRVRFALNVMAWEQFTAQLDVDFKDAEVDVNDVWLGYNGLPNSIVRVGQFREPFSIDELTSSRYITFMERSTVSSTFAPSRHVGVGYQRWGKSYNVGVGAFGEGADAVDETGEDKARGFTGRVGVVPLNDANRSVHFGAGITYRTPEAGGGDTVRFRTRPETHLARTRFADTGKISKVDYWTVWNLEAAGSVGPFHWQGEYMQADVERLVGTLPSVKLSGYYAQVGWIVTGEHKTYDGEQGELGSITPEGKLGAFEVAARYSVLDLNDLAANVKGGEEKILTVGLNWHYRPTVRLMVNFGHVENDAYATGGGKLIPDDSYDMLQTRVGFYF